MKIVNHAIVRFGQRHLKMFADVDGSDNRACAAAVKANATISRHITIAIRNLVSKAVAAGKTADVACGSWMDVGAGVLVVYRDDKYAPGKKVITTVGTVADFGKFYPGKTLRN